MKRLLHIVILALILGSCHEGPKRIPEKEMRSIIREALISEAIVQEAKTIDGRTPDSLDLHTRILARYGYTMEDFRFTIREMSMRKSNPLPNILTGVALDIKASRVGAEDRYKQQLGIDSVALARTADTVFRSDTILRGALDGYRIVYTGHRPADSTVQAGTYKPRFAYSTGKHARSFTKSIRLSQTATSGKSNENTLWLPVAKDTTDYEGDILVRPNTKMLEIKFAEISRPGQSPDTCYLSGIELVYHLPIDKARALYMQQLTGLPTDLFDHYEKQYLDSLQKSGGPLPPLTGR